MVPAVVPEQERRQGVTLGILAIREGSTALGVIPLAWLTVLRFRGQVRHAGWWRIALGFGVSFVVDVLAHFTKLGQPELSFVYPVAQVGLVCSAFLLLTQSSVLTAVLAAVAIASAVTGDVTKPELLLRSVAWLAVCGVVYDRPVGRIRVALLVYFGLGLLPWYWFAATRSLPSMLAYQGVRALGIALFCSAAFRPGPKFGLSS